VKKITISIIAGLIGLPLLFMLSARLFLDSERTNTNHGTQASSELQVDELSLTSDIKLLRRDLRRGAGVIVVAKDRNFVRQDLLNIAIDRWRPAEESEELARDQDLASLIGEWFAAPAQELSQNLVPLSHS
jgi:hypothetical protein